MAYDRLLIRDLGSRNRIRVNGLVVDEARLNSGDEVAIAHFLYRLEGLEPAPQLAKRAEAPPTDKDPAPLIDLDDDFIPLD